MRVAGQLMLSGHSYVCELLSARRGSFAEARVYSPAWVRRLPALEGAVRA